MQTVELELDAFDASEIASRVNRRLTRDSGEPPGLAFLPSPSFPPSSLPLPPCNTVTVNWISWISSSAFRVIIAALICHSVHRSRISRHGGRLVPGCRRSPPPLPARAKSSFGISFSEKNVRRSSKEWPAIGLDDGSAVSRA